MAACILIINAGSSSLKARLFPHDYSFVVERIGGQAHITARLDQYYEASQPTIVDHASAIVACLDLLDDLISLSDVAAVGHRIVHGGERYTQPTLLTAEVLADLYSLNPLAPLHNPANLSGIAAAQHVLPQVPHVAVFDTAFHSQMPPRAYLFALPYELYQDEGIRRYGFHGSSHDFVTSQAATLLGRPRSELKLISLHLGNGASTAAVAGGHSVDTSMGFTPMDGLVMGTRVGDLDPGVVLHLLREGRSLADVDQMLNQHSGLLGISGLSNDMRDLRRAEAQGHERARLALDVFCYHIRRSIGSSAVAMGGLDAVIFTGGIGEHDAKTREQALEGTGFMGIALDLDKNQRHETFVQQDDSRVKLMVIPTNEERLMADKVTELLSSG